MKNPFYKIHYLDFWLIGLMAVAAVFCLGHLVGQNYGMAQGRAMEQARLAAVTAVPAEVLNLPEGGAR